MPLRIYFGKSTSRFMREEEPSHLIRRSTDRSTCARDASQYELPAKIIARSEAKLVLHFRIWPIPGADDSALFAVSAAHKAAARVSGWVGAEFPRCSYAHYLDELAPRAIDPALDRS